MTSNEYLTLLSFLGLLVGLIAGVTSQIAKTSETVDGSNIKRLTTAGKLALGISLIGFMGSFASELLKVSIAADHKKTETLEAERRAERQKSEDEWRQRSEQLLNAAVSKADDNIRHVIEGFKAEQRAILDARLDVAEAKQKVLSDNLLRETRLYGRLSATSTPLTKLTIKLVVQDVSEEIRTKLQKAIAAAKQRPDAPDFQDLVEHHNADDEDQRALVRSEMDQHAIQPFITWLATGEFELKQGILLFGLNDYLSAIACIGWIESPDLFDRTYPVDQKKKADKKSKIEKKVTKLPSGIVVGKEIEWKLSYEKDTRDYVRERNTRPTTSIDVSDRSVILTIDLDHLALRDALLRYAPNTATTASLPDNLAFVAWSPSRTGDVDSAFGLEALPFDSSKIGESLSDLSSRKIALKKNPAWEHDMKLELIPNGVGEIAKAYRLAAIAEEELMEGSRADESHGYARIWHAQVQ